jgi:VRR-NUC domain
MKSTPKKNQSLPKITANALTKQALITLSMSGFHVWRQNNGGVFDPTKKVFRRNSSTPGISDILGYQKKTGKILAIEIKSGKDVLSPAQVEFLDGIEKAGGYSFVVRTPDDIKLIAEIFRPVKLTNSVNNLKK